MDEIYSTLEFKQMKEQNEYSQEELDNHANQLNPNHDAYWQSRGEDERPDDWEDRIEDEDDN